MTQETEFRDAKYATSARSQAMLIDNTYVEYRVAVKMPDDKWNVTKVEIKPTESGDYSVSVKQTRTGEDFVKAMQELADFEKVADTLPNWHIVEDIAEQNVPNSFYETEHYTPVCEREGIAFGKNGRPHAFYGDHIVTDGTFKLSELNNCHETVKAQKGDKLDRVVRKGALSELFANQGNDNTGNLDSKINAFKAMGRMDNFMSTLGKFNELLEQATQDSDVYHYVEDFVDRCEDALNECEEVGIYTAPFSKLVAECEVTAYTICAQVMMHDVINNAQFDDEGTLETAQNLVEQAAEKYQSRGGSQEGIDRIKHAITQGDKISVPQEITKIIDRYNKRKAETQQALKNEISGSKPKPTTPTAAKKG